LRNINQPGFHGSVKISMCLIMPTISGDCIKWFVICNLYIVQVKPLRCFSRILPQLTHWVDNFEVSCTVPVCCVPKLCGMILISVEYKKVRIIHKLLYVKYRKPMDFVWPCISLLQWCK